MIRLLSSLLQYGVKLLRFQPEFHGVPDAATGKRLSWFIAGIALVVAAGVGSITGVSASSEIGATLALAVVVQVVYPVRLGVVTLSAWLLLSPVRVAAGLVGEPVAMSIVMGMHVWFVVATMHAFKIAANREDGSAR